MDDAFHFIEMENSIELLVSGHQLRLCPLGIRPNQIIPFSTHREGKREWLRVCERGTEGKRGRENAQKKFESDRMDRIEGG